MRDERSKERYDHGKIMENGKYNNASRNTVNQSLNGNGGWK